MTRADRWVLGIVVALGLSAPLAPLGLQAANPALRATLHFLDGPRNASARDAWGQPYPWPEDTSSPHWPRYSFGPNGVDEQGSGDDLRLHTAYSGPGVLLVVWMLLAPALILLAFLVGAPYLAWRQWGLPRSGRAELEVVRGALITLPLLPLCLGAGLAIADETPETPLLLMPAPLGAGFTLYGLCVLAAVWQRARGSASASAD